MKLNWKKIRWDMSIRDIQDFIRINGDKLTLTQIFKLYKRIERQRQSNLKFAIALVNSDLFKAGIALTGRKYRVLSGLKSQDLISDKKLFSQYKNEVIDNMVKVRNRIADFQQPKLIARTKCQKNRKKKE